MNSYSFFLSRNKKCPFICPRPRQKDKREVLDGAGFLLISLPLSEFLCLDGATANPVETPVPLVNSFRIRSLDFPPISVIS